MNEVEYEKSDKKVILIVTIFLIIAGFLTMFLGSSTKKYDSNVSAYKIKVEKDEDSEGTTIYRPIYYYKVNNNIYVCKSSSSGSIYPNLDKNTVYYDSINPGKCKTEYDTGSYKLISYIFWGVALFLIICVLFGNKSSKNNENNINDEKAKEIAEKTEAVINSISRVVLIFKKVVLGFIIIVLGFFQYIDMKILIQTIKSKDYIKATATYSHFKENTSDSIFDDYIYTFIDNGKEYEIVCTDNTGSEIEIKYDKTNPNNNYYKGQYFDKNGLIWFIVKTIIFIGLIFLFFNNNLLNKINISVRK